MDILNDKIINLLLKRNGKCYYYFNNEGVYTSVTAESIYDIPEEVDCRFYNPESYSVNLNYGPALFVKKEARKQFKLREAYTLVNRLILGDTVEYFDSVIKSYLNGGAVTDRRINFSKTVKIKDIRMVVLRKECNYAYYFNKKGIYCSSLITKIGNELRYLPDEEIRNLCGITSLDYCTFRHAIILIPEGATIKYFESMISSNDMALYVDTHDPCVYPPKYFITSIDKPKIRRTYYNHNDNTFDYIEIYATVICMDKSYIRNNLRGIVNLIIKKIASDEAYKKYNIEVNFLRLTGYELVKWRTKTIKFIFELKNIQQ